MGREPWSHSPVECRAHSASSKGRQRHAARVEPVGRGAPARSSAACVVTKSVNSISTGLEKLSRETPRGFNNNLHIIILAPPPPIGDCIQASTSSSVAASFPYGYLSLYRYSHSTDVGTRSMTVPVGLYLLRS
eukprot:COSAG05_NODE_634_length_8193_cov_7.035083_3_plen_133_part_00